MTKQIAILPGDGIGPEITAQAVRVLDKLISDGLDARYEYAPLGGAAYDQYGHPYPEFTQNLCRAADAVLLGAVGGPQYDTLERPLRPERGLLAIRKDLGLFANLRPAVLYKELADASTLKPEVVAGLDILIVRELTGDIYFGEPRSHMYVDNAAMQLVRAPKQFDVIATGNIFGDILSDQASMLTGSIGMLPSASLNESGKGLYEPSHGSAPDIAGQDKANPLATILSLAMLLRYSLNDEARAQKVESAVQKVLEQGLRTADIMQDGGKLVSCSEMGSAVVAAL